MYSIRKPCTGPNDPTARGPARGPAAVDSNTIQYNQTIAVPKLNFQRDCTGRAGRGGAVRTRRGTVQDRARGTSDGRVRFVEYVEAGNWENQFLSKLWRGFTPSAGVVPVGINVSLCSKYRSISYSFPFQFANIVAALGRTIPFSCVSKWLPTLTGPDETGPAISRRVS